MKLLFNKIDKFLRQFKRWEVFLLLLVPGLFVSIAAYYTVDTQVKNTNQIRFDREAERITKTIANRLEIHVRALKSMAGFFYGSDQVSRNEWKRYTANIDFPEYPGALGYGFIRYVPRKNLQEFLIKTKKDEAPDFQLKTKENHPDLFIIEYIEPYERNMPARGLDIGSEKNRRDAAKDAVIQDKAIMTRKITLVQDEKRIAGFLLLHPLYIRNIYSIEVNERWNNLRGWTYTPIRIDELMNGIVEAGGGISDFVVFEEDSSSRENILYDSGRIFSKKKENEITQDDYNNFSYRKETSIQVSGRIWKIDVLSKPEFTARGDVELSIFTLIAGVLISILVAALYSSATHTRENALSLAEKMTVSLKKSEQDAKDALSELKNQKFALDQHAIVAITDTKGTITYVNQKFCEISGYSREELLGQNHRILNSGYHSMDFFKQLFEVITSGNVWQGEIRNRKKDGTYYWVATTIVPFKNEFGEVYQYIVIRADITTMKQSEENLRLANMTKDKFFNIIAHDLKNPFNGILGITELFISEVDDGVDAKQQKEYLNLIYKSSRSAYNLLENLLLWARAQGRQIEFHPIQISFREMVKETIPLLSGNLMNKKIHLIEKLTEDDMVHADPFLMNTILRNILTNAVKFTNFGGTIEIRTYVNGDFLMVEIKDSGIGMEQEHLDKLFRLDEKVTRPGTDNEPGTGLGLLICKEFVEKHGGQIHVESRFGEGSTFKFSILRC